MKSLQEFGDWGLQVKHTGNPDVYNSYDGECVSLIQQLLDQVFGIPFKARGNAKDWSYNEDVLSHFDRLPSSTALKPGDIICYGSNYGGGFGHLGLIDCNGKFYDQNGCISRKIGYRDYPFTGYICVLRFKGSFVVKVEKPKEEVKPNNGYVLSHKIGDKVRFSTCYTSSTAPNSEAILSSNMQRDYGTITKIVGGAKNPYLLDNGLCWVNDGDIRETISNEPAEPIIYARNNLVVYSHFYRWANDINAVDCMNEYGAWQQRFIIDIVNGARNPYKLDNGLYLNNEAIKELK